MSNLTFSTNDIPLGTCQKCSKKQTAKARGGFFINGLKDKWICDDCWSKTNIRSIPLACEWCTYEHIVRFQGHTYDCDRCNELNIR